METAPVFGLRPLAEVEREHVLGVVRVASSMKEASAILGVPVSSLYRLVKSYQGKE